MDFLRMERSRFGESKRPCRRTNSYCNGATVYIMGPSNHPANSKEKSTFLKTIGTFVELYLSTSTHAIGNLHPGHHSGRMHLCRCRQATGRAASWELSWTKLRRNRNSCEVASGDIVCRVQKRPRNGWNLVFQNSEMQRCLINMCLLWKGLICCQFFLIVPSYSFMFLQFRRILFWISQDIDVTSSLSQGLAVHFGHESWNMAQDWRKERLCSFFSMRKSTAIFWDFSRMLIFSQVLSMMVGIRMFGPQQVHGRLQRHTVSDASEVVGQLHAANTKCIENFSLLKPQNLMKQSMTCTLKIHEVFIMCVCVVFHCLVGFGTSGTSIHNFTLCVFLLILSHIVYKIDIISVLPNSRCFFIAPLFWIVWRMRSLLN